MKKKHYIALGILIAFLLLLPFTILAFKILYRLIINHNWAGLSVVGIWLCAAFILIAALVAGLAIFYAIQVPKRITHEQNKVALFEKRYEMYNLLYDWRYIAEQIILYATTTEDARAIFIEMYDAYDNDSRTLSNRMLSRYRKTVDELYKLYFLFPINNAIHDRVVAFVDVVYKILIGNSIATHKKELKLLLKTPEIKYIFEIMQHELRISK